MKVTGSLTLIIMQIIAHFPLRATVSRARLLSVSRLLSTKSGSIGGNVDLTRLSVVRSVLQRSNVDAFVIPTDDSHMSEYTAPYFGRREFVSGFTGSAGTAIVTEEKALLFTDGRYHSQAEAELDSSWTLMRVGLSGVPSPANYLAENLPERSTVGIDPHVHSADAFRKLAATLGKKNINLKALSSNPIDEAWGASRPAKPSGAIREHPLKFAGQSVAEKLQHLRKSMKQQSAGVFVVTMLDEIAWLYNIRGSDVSCNPVAICYAMVTDCAAYLFIDANKVPGDVSQSLAQAGVEIRPYESLGELLAMAGSGAMGKVWMDSRTANQAVYSSIPAEHRLSADSPIALLKACKNSAELQGMRACHLRDGAAIVELLAWLDERYADPTNAPLSEVTIDDKLTACRAQCDQYIENSFPTIAGVNANAATIHYRAKEGSCSTLTGHDLLLLDSGAQYTDGTTDITRTIHMGQPTAYQKEMFTRVLKGHIALDSQVFPQGTPGCMLDTLARQHLWAAGKNYLHGTGHGVGAALNVHEGPQRISTVLADQALLPGMIVSNEPGYYEDGNFGIRIENLLEVVEKPSLQFGGKGFLGFRRLTHVPIQRKLMDLRLLSSKEIEWMDTYHDEVREKVGPLLTTDRARTWLDKATEPIE